MPRCGAEFRSRLVAHGASERVLQVLVARFKERGLIKVRGNQRTDSTQVLGAVRLLNRLELVSETLRAALEDIATVAPEWVKSWVPQEWIERYGRRIEEGRWPKGEAARQQYAQQVGADGARLLARVQEADAPAVVREVARVQELGIVWQQQYEQQTRGIHLVGPVRPDPGWQAQQHTGYDTAQFSFDWQAKQATCPQGQTSVSWTERTEQRSGRPIVAVQFATATCRA
jgi:hypothetical protein